MAGSFRFGVAKRLSDRSIAIEIDKNKCTNIVKYNVCRVDIVMNKSERIKMLDSG